MNNNIDYKKNTKESFIPIILLLIFGIVLLINPINFLNSMINVIAYAAIFMGVLHLFFYFRLPNDEKSFSSHLSSGIILIIYGIIAFFINESIRELIPVLIGGYIIFQSASRINLVMSNKTIKFWVVNLVMSIVSLVFGIIIMLNPYTYMLEENFYMAYLLIGAEAILLAQSIMLLFTLKGSNIVEVK